MKAREFLDEKESQARRLAASLPEDQAALLALAKQTTDYLHASIIAGDDAAAASMSERYDAIVWILNGRTFFGCKAHAHSGGNLVAEHCRAEPGAVPQWSQRGEFLIVVQGMRCVVEHKEGYGYLHSSFGLHAVDTELPFISETGYRSAFANAIAGMTVEEAAIAIMEKCLADDGRKPIKRDSIAHRQRDKTRWTWLEEMAAPSAADMAYEDRRGQMAFGF